MVNTTHNVATKTTMDPFLGAMRHEWIHYSHMVGQLDIS